MKKFRLLALGMALGLSSLALTATPGTAAMPCQALCHKNNGLCQRICRKNPCLISCEDQLSACLQGCAATG
jgi:hypothetical protein